MAVFFLIGLGALGFFISYEFTAEGEVRIVPSTQPFLSSVPLYAGELKEGVFLKSNLVMTPYEVRGGSLASKAMLPFGVGGGTRSFVDQLASREIKKNSQFQSPTEGFNWGRRHGNNGVDIANACGTAIRAAADGLVIEAVTGSWNSGFGNAVLLEHPDGTKTRYAHLRMISVDLGDFVRAGGRIGEMGQTGEATGCHLHFEVLGAKNPFVTY